MQLAANIEVTLWVAFPLASLTMHDPAGGDAQVRESNRELKDGRRSPWEPNSCTCGDGDTQVDDTGDEDGEQGSFWDGHLGVLQA